MPNPTDRLIIGTAGHIDHGKSTLVRALTGVDPDRLKEEKERGITIVLGFAPLDLPSGRRCGVIDVPGHERLVRTMIAGASGVDLLLLVVAADEGSMPQTREHLAICQLLGIQQGLVAITKSDLVDEEWLELVRSDLADELRGTFLEGSPIVTCSSSRGDGLDELKSTIDLLVDKATRRDADGLLRMPVDRVFSMKGFGTVATGTLNSGRIRVGDPVVLIPSGLEGKVRGLQVHGESVEASIAGTRTAVNFQGAETNEVHRGQWLLHPNTISPSYRLDVKASLLSAFPRPLKARTRVLLHAGTTHVEAIMRLLDSETLQPGGEAYAHIELSAPIIALSGDRLILRGTERLAGHGHTIGGAVVIRPQARRPRKKEKTLAELVALHTAETEDERLSLIVDHEGISGVELKELLAKTGIGPQATRSALKRLVKSGALIAFGASGYVHSHRLTQLEQLALERIDEYHRGQPLEPAMPREELRTKLPGVKQALFGEILQVLRRRPELVVEKEAVRRADFKPETARADVEELKKKLVARLESSGLTPPRDKELADELDVSLKELAATLKLLVGEGVVVKVAEGLHFASPCILELRDKIVQHLEKEEKMDAQQFKAITGASRKFTIPLGEYFDREKITMRVGQSRVLRRKPSTSSS